MRIVVLVALFTVVSSASAQPGSGVESPPTPAPTASEPSTTPAPSTTPVPSTTPAASSEELRKTCVAAMNADPAFALKVVSTTNNQTAQAHINAARDIAKNERHVILAYAAMWLVAVAFVIFLWRRQQALRLEIAQLRRDLDAAAKDGK